jgi:hypothetical protein
MVFFGSRLEPTFDFPPEDTVIRRTMLLISVALALGGSSGYARADFTFVLDPGSTITPTGGVAEELTGSFVLRDMGFDSGLSVFDAIALSLKSRSFTLTLDVSPANNVASDLFPDGTSYFYEVVDATGLAPTLLQMVSNVKGSYSGTISDPTRLSYSDIKLPPAGGGLYAASINFTATAVSPVVPEPSSLVLASFGLAGLGLYAMRRRV